MKQAPFTDDIVTLCIRYFALFDAMPLAILCGVREWTESELEVQGHRVPVVYSITFAPWLYAILTPDDDVLTRWSLYGTQSIIRYIKSKGYEVKGASDDYGINFLTILVGTRRIYLPHADRGLSVAHMRKVVDEVLELGPQ